MSKRELSISTADGTVPARVYQPKQRAVAGRTQAGVIFYMDAFGLRPALDVMGERLADEGYVVLMPDIFYRAGDYGPLDAKTGFSDDGSRQKILGLMAATTQKMTETDSAAFLDALAGEGVDGKIGVVGYCMGGARAIAAAIAYPDRISAAASFHGGGLASEEADSPHRRVAALTGRIYVGTAGVDGSFPPEQSATLAQALRIAEVDHAIENYAGMKHGWTVPDHGAFSEKGAERHWKRLGTFFSEALQ